MTEVTQGMIEVTKAAPIWGTGRRKRAVARVRLLPGEGKIVVNKHEVDAYFPEDKDRLSVMSPLVATGSSKTFSIFVNVSGGGKSGQADAVKLGIARALLRADVSFEKALRDGGFMTRDPRMKERKKYGQKGARKRFQFSKR
jgi:small subunit ribosomal protein S9